MAERAFTSTKADVSKMWQFGRITGSATANKLVDTDTSQALSVTGVRKIYASAIYTKGSSTNGKFDILVDGVVRASSATSTTDGEVLTATVTVPVESTIAIKATITGTATGAFIGSVVLGETQPQY